MSVPIAPVPMSNGAVDAPEPPQMLAPPAAHRAGIWHIIHRYPAIATGATILSILLLIAIFAPLLGTIDPAAPAPIRRTLPPSAEYWFGTDMLGRDLYSRVMYGARVSLMVGISVALIASLAGAMIGLVSGFLRWSDGVIMRIMDGLMAIPPVLLAIALMTLTRASIANVILAIAIAETPSVARLVRGTVLSLRQQPYVEAAIVAGTRPSMIIWRHILPNAVAPIAVQATYICAAAMIIEAILSFIGAGTPSAIPSWGNIMADGRALWQVKPHIIFFPAAFLSITVLAVNLLGDGLRDFLDPRMTRTS